MSSGMQCVRIHSTPAKLNSLHYLHLIAPGKNGKKQSICFLGFFVSQTTLSAAK